MANTVYVETSVFSAYVSGRSDARSIAWRQSTREWWAGQRTWYDCFISQEVVDEVRGGEYRGQDEAIELLNDLPLLEIEDEIRAISHVYVREMAMPGPAGQGDSLHLAVASFHQVDFLLTWNIRHLANPSKQDQLMVVNRRLGLLTPVICTPDMLWWEEQ